MSTEHRERGNDSPDTIGLGRLGGLEERKEKAISEVRYFMSQTVSNAMNFRCLTCSGIIIDVHVA